MVARSVCGFGTRVFAFFKGSLVSGILGSVFLACAGSNVQTPHGDASDWGATARALHNGVTVVTVGGTWQGDARITEQSIPILVTIENHGRRPVRIQYSNIYLVAQENRRISALPLIGLIPGERRVELGPSWQPGPLAFLHAGFQVAPYLAGVYTDIRQYRDYFPFDLHYLSTRYARWPRPEDLTPAVILTALPEGVLEPEGHVQGFLFFDRVPSETKTVTLTATFEDATAPWGEEQIASLQVPLKVRKKIRPW